MKRITVNGRTILIQFQMRNLVSAFSFADGCESAMFVVMGDAGMYWIVSGANAQRLEKAGYEIAPR